MDFSIHVLLFILAVGCIAISNWYIKYQDRVRIAKLLRQTARWSTAAEQDTNVYIKNLHATYAIGYLLALKELYSEKEIKDASGVDIRELEDNITVVMDNSIKEIAKICPEGRPKNEFLSKISKQS